MTRSRPAPSALLAAALVLLSGVGCARLLGTPPGADGDDGGRDGSVEDGGPDASSDAEGDGDGPADDADRRDADGGDDADDGGSGETCEGPVCDTWPQCGCEPGLKCAETALGVAGCVLAGDLPHGAACLRDAECAVGTTCNATVGTGVALCAQYCSSDRDCAGLGDGSLCALVSVRGGFTLCSDPCDPVTAAPCPEGVHCAFGRHPERPAVMLAQCGGAAAGDGGVGEPCADYSDCAPPLACADFACRPLCVVAGAETCLPPTVCTELEEHPTVGSFEYGACN